MAASFAAAIASRYSGVHPGLPRIRYWQIQNEPNLSMFFLPQFDSRNRPVSPEAYRLILNRSYDAIKAVNKTNVVIAAGLAPIGRPGNAVHPMRFARELFCLTRRNHVAKGCSGRVKLDVFDIHPYTTGSPSRQSRHRDDIQMGDLKKLVGLLAAAGRNGRVIGMYKRTPLWITEMAWDSKPPDPGGVPFRILSRWTSEAIYQAWKAGVDHFFWLSLRDGDRGDRPFNETFESGLYFRGQTLSKDRPKPSLRAFRFPFVSYLKGQRIAFWGRTPIGTQGKVLIQIKQGARWRRLGWTSANRFGIIRGSLVVDTSTHMTRSTKVRAVFRGHVSVPFSLVAPKDFYQPPFGRLQSEH